MKPIPKDMDTCAHCGSTDDVALVSPDMDIQPVPLCLVCLWGDGAIFGRDYTARPDGSACGMGDG